MTGRSFLENNFFGVVSHAVTQVILVTQRL